MITAVTTLTGFGILSGICLAIASKKFAVEKDARVEQILENLPGVNCGACGYPGCAGLSEAIASGKAAPGACPVSSSEMREVIGSIMGLEVQHGLKKVPRLLCGGNENCAVRSAQYEGPMDCSVMSLASGAGKVCQYGCLGGGSCAAVCPAGAITISSEGLPVVDEDKCISCGICVKECPRKVLVMASIDKTVVIACSSMDTGPVTRKACTTGCIGCKMCEKVCPEQAITVNNFLAVIDFAKCTSCGKCMEKCPTKAIKSLAH